MARTLRFRSLDGTQRRSISGTSAPRIYRRLRQLEAEHGIDEVFVDGAWRSISPATEALVRRILRA